MDATSCWSGSFGLYCDHRSTTPAYCGPATRIGWVAPVLRTAVVISCIPAAVKFTAAPVPPLMASQQSSFIGRRTALICHDFMAAIEVASSVGPSKMPHPSAHAYSAPDRLTPRSWTTRPAASTIALPDTLTCGAAPTGAGVG